ncbi:phosphotransferase family protein [Pseudomonas sp. RP23018S]|uniref:phosphotransferase family protein n=1 Tax=Pseudomonas sp. RP23018S TaxID=3096037 RepID=UPI002ACAB7DE|nr:phosphotransferase family protein [Pseudomonas sp. RP23018S]MDZ5603851.1 phosphotransferase family protein [Pseudomonas sp. RP23018S]
MSLTDRPTQVRSGETFDVAVIDAYLKAHLPGLTGTPELSQFPGGASNLTYLLRYADRELVLRRPPFGHKAKSAHDMGREFRILNRLNAGFPYCPKAYLHCTDAALIGSEFYLMQRVEGIILRADLPPALGLGPAQTQTLCESFIDRLAELHQVDYHACGLGDLGKPDGYVQRQIEGWASRYAHALTADAPHWEQVITWLREHQPADHPRPALLHNDYRLDNVILDPVQPTRIIGVLDWEMATLGDPLMDLGTSLAYWIEATDPAPIQQLRRQPSNAPGMLSRRQFVERYAERSGLQLDNVDFYHVYGLFRLAGIIQQIYYRYFHGQTQDKRFASFIQMNHLLEQMTLQIIARSPL